MKQPKWRLEVKHGGHWLEVERGRWKVEVIIAGASHVATAGIYGNTIEYRIIKVVQGGEY